MGSLILHEQSIHTCGQPAHESFDPDGPQYSMEDDFCRACKVLGEHDSSNDEPGTSWHLDVRR